MRVLYVHGHCVRPDGSKDTFWSQRATSYVTRADGKLYARFDGVTRLVPRRMVIKAYDGEVMQFEWVDETDTGVKS